MKAFSRAHLKELDALVRMALARWQLATLPTVSAPAQTLNAAAVTVDTGYAPPAGHSVKLDGGVNVHDATADTTSSKNVNASLRNFGGPAVAGVPVVAGTTGDASLSTATISLSIVGTTLHVTFTPPAAYVGTLVWLATLNATEN